MKKYLALACAILLFCSYAKALDFDVHSIANRGAKQTSPSVQSDQALAWLKLDIENNPGWVASAKGGYQWKLFRDAGVRINDGVATRTFTGSRTKTGFAGNVGFGYNFGNVVPITLGLEIGLGPSGNLNTSGVLGGGNTFNAKQKIRSYTLDFSLDYDINTCTRWVPFVGLTVGGAYHTDKGRITISDGAGLEIDSGSHGKKKRFNLVGGARAGTKWRFNERVTFSLFGAYTYLGKVGSHNLDLDTGTSGYSASSTKAKIHQIDLKLGVKIVF